MFLYIIFEFVLISSAFLFPYMVIAICKKILLHRRKFSQNTMRARSLPGFLKTVFNCRLSISPKIFIYIYIYIHEYDWNSMKWMSKSLFLKMWNPLKHYLLRKADSFNERTKYFVRKKSRSNSYIKIFKMQATNWQTLSPGLLSSGSIIVIIIIINFLLTNLPSINSSSNLDRLI